MEQRSSAKDSVGGAGYAPVRCATAAVQMDDYYVYITTNHTGSVLYVGVTNALEQRASEHRLRSADGFTKRYKAGKLVYYESTTDVRAAIAREKEIKGWSRRKKLALIESMSPRWKDLADKE